MTTLTKKDRDNLAAVSALLENKAQSYATAIPNKALAKRFGDWAATLAKARELLREREDRPTCAGCRREGASGVHDPVCAGCTRNPVDIDNYSAREGWKEGGAE